MVIEDQSTIRTARPKRKVALAVLDESTAAQLRSNLDETSDLEIVWSGTDVDAFRAEAPKAQVVLANIELLGETPSEGMNELVDRTGAELGIALYAYAKRSTLDEISSQRIRTLRSPLNLPMLRCQMMGLIARNLLRAPPPPTEPDMSAAPNIEPPIYSNAQLGKLQQISTAVDCECPNHLAVLLQNLSDFENYSKNCENKNDEDAKIHRMLYEHTAQARALLERAMGRLIEHEQIEV